MRRSRLGPPIGGGGIHRAELEHLLTRRIDAGGARRKAAQRQQAADTRREEWRADCERVIKAAGRIPMLKTLDEITSYATETLQFMTTSSSLSFPALQVNKKLSTNGIFKALPVAYGRVPNIKAERYGETSVGPHFDDYANGFMPWTLLDNHSGTGAIRAMFLPKAQFKAYRELTKTLPHTYEADEMLAQTRASMGSIALNTASVPSIYVGKIEPGSRVLLWHGDAHTPPAVHDITRNEPGDYTIYAIQEHGDLGAGFVSID